MAPLLCYFKLCAAFRSHWWIQPGVTFQKRPIWVKIDDFFSHVTFKFDGWPWENNRGHLFKATYIKLCASFHLHMWIQTGVTVQKRLNGVMTSVTLTFDLWPWPFAWTSILSMVITSENFMIRWQKQSEKGLTDRRTERSVLRAAWSQLKNLCKW